VIDPDDINDAALLVDGQYDTVLGIGAGGRLREPGTASG
jgi:hypothetical protein